jgi:cell wall-associated NlpC family hydrolase
MPVLRPVVLTSARRLTALVFAAFVAAGVVVSVPGTAYAAPSPEEIERQIDAEWVHLEPVIEQYNAVRIELASNRSKADALQRQMQPLETEVDLASGRVGALAAQAYKGGRPSMITAILRTGSPSALPGELSRLEFMARKQRAEVDGMTATLDKYTSDKRALDDLITRQAAQEAELATQKKQIESRIAELERMQRQATAAAGPAPVTQPAGSCPVQRTGGPGDKAAETACRQIGKMYVFGAEGPNNFDCSGLTKYAWISAGRTLPHNARQQYGATRRVSSGELRPGDLVFYYSDIHHVGIYVGGGQMVHASRAGKPVAMVAVSRSGMTPMGYGRVA